MLKKLVRDAWKILPAGVRLKIVRISQTKFTVSAAAVIVNPRNEVLLLNHVLRPFSGWGLPGGFVNSSEQPEDAVRREISEETGLELSDVRLIRIRTVRQHIEILFQATTDSEPGTLSREIFDWGWFVLEDLPKEMGKSQTSVIRKVLESEV